ncbi:MAG: hypothetical protein HDQ98_13040 [Lachnospiraceae bacterium]|nr:hypothetical protein [Lachnospiraceae bacterium]
MKNKIKTAAGALWLALCFLTVFFCCTEEVRAESGQLTHRHSGSRENGGGCYGTKKSVTWDCHSYNVSVSFNGTEYVYVCGQCGTRWTGPVKLDGSRCSGQSTETYYELNCGKDGAAAVSFSCEKSTQDWAKELDLTASYSVHEGGINISGFLWNGSPGGARCHVTENGTYTLGLVGSGNVSFSPTISVTVDHIDNTPPGISSFQTASDAWGSSVQLIVNASDGQSGLAGEAYSYDGGASWSSSNTHTVTANGAYSVSVRDAVGNVSTAETTVEHIDCTPPTISVSTSPSVDNWYDGSLTVTIQAQDVGGGLADAPYSFDGGATYSVGNSVTLSGSGTLEIAVADRAGNVTRLSFHAEKKQRPQPTPAPDSGSGTGAGGGNTGSGAAGNTGGVAGTGGTGTGGTGAGSENGVGPGGTGAGSENGVGPDGTGTDGTNGNVGSNGGTGSSGSNTNGTDGIAAGGTGSGSGNGNTGADGSGTGSAADAGTEAGVSGISNGTGSTGRGQRSTQGNQNADGTEDGTGNSKGGKKDRYGSGADGTYEVQFDAEGTLPQHYPGGLPRVGSMTNGHQNESGTDSAVGAGSTDVTGGMDGIGVMDGTEGTDEFDSLGGTDGAREEEAIIQNELLASAGEQEAAILQRTGASAGAERPYVSMPMLIVGAALLAAAGVFGWAMLFGVRIDTRDEKGHYRFAGITRVTTKEQERLRVVPLTKQIIRNSHTNELRIRFGPLCHKCCEGETLLLRYRSMRREFKAQRTVELHIRA